MALKLTKLEKVIFDKLSETRNVVHTSVLNNLELPKIQTVSDKRVKSHISNLRRKLPKGMEIQSVRGVGYRLVKRKV